MRIFVVAAAGILVAGTSAAAQSAGDGKAVNRPETVTRVLDCRSVASDSERLACYDREVAAFQAAEASRDLVIYDREQMRRTRKSLFGIPLPSLNIFGGGDEDGGEEQSEDVTEIESTIRSVRQNADEQYTFVLEDGARWVQIDRRELSARPREGQKIRIRRAAMGSYLANVGTQTAIRVRRILPAD